MTVQTPAPAPQGNPNPDPANPIEPSAPPLVPEPKPAESPSVTPDAPKAWHEDPAIQEYAIKRATVDGKVDQKLADKTLARLKRFPSLNDALDWAFNSDKKIAEGTWKKEQGKAPETPEEIAAYREANGIPEAPEGYTEKLPDGLVIGDEDRPAIDFFTKRFHDANLSEAQGQALIKGYYDMVDEQEGSRQQANLAAKESLERQMRAELGPRYTETVNLEKNYLESFPESVREKIYQSTLPDGSQILNDPEVFKAFAQKAIEHGHTGTTLPSGQQVAKTLTDEIAQIEVAMKDLGSAYYKGPKTPGGETVMRARYRDLLDQQSALASKQRKAG